MEEFEKYLYRRKYIRKYKGVDSYYFFIIRWSEDCVGWESNLIDDLLEIIFRDLKANEELSKITDPKLTNAELDLKMEHWFRFLEREYPQLIQNNRIP